MNEQLAWETLLDLKETIEKTHSQATKVKLFQQFLPDIPIEEIDDYKIILPTSFKHLITSFKEWAYTDEYCEKPIAVHTKAYLI
jgi:hypothetical protein